MANYLLWFIIALIVIGAFGILLFGFDALTVITASLTFGGVMLAVFIIVAVAAGLALVARKLSQAGLLIPFLLILLAPFVFMVFSVISSGQPILDVPAIVRSLFPI